MDEHWDRDEGEAHDELFDLVYGELRGLAERYLGRERGGHTLQPTALVHEAFVRLSSGERRWESRGGFFRTAARAMRRVLVDHARSRRRLKRGEGRGGLVLDEALVAYEERALDLIELDEALDELGRTEARLARTVELHFFGGQDSEEIAGALGVSPRTARRDLQFARAWLRRRLGSSEGGGR